MNGIPQLSNLPEGEKLKANNRRASGLVAYPRIGRNSDLLNFARSNRAAGLVYYPRVGRSDIPLPNVNFDMVPDQDLQFYNADLNLAVDQDYEGEAPIQSPFVQTHIFYF